MQHSPQSYSANIAIDFETNSFQGFILTEVGVSWNVKVLVWTILFGKMNKVISLHFAIHSLVDNVCISCQLLTRCKVECNFIIGEYFGKSHLVKLSQKRRFTLFRRVKFLISLVNFVYDVAYFVAASSEKQIKPLD